MILHGRNLIIKTGGIAIAAAKSCTISIKRDRFEVSSPINGVYKSYMFGRRSWSIQVYQLVVSLAKMKDMVGTTVAIEVILDEEGLPFNGFVSNVTITTGTYTSRPSSIVWDKTLQQFLGVVSSSGTTLYYAAWANSSDYTSPTAYALYSYNGVLYSWLGGELSSEKLTGNGDVLSWECAGAVGNLATGNFQIGGNGGLYTAPLP